MNYVARFFIEIYLLIRKRNFSFVLYSIIPHIVTAVFRAKDFLSDLVIYSTWQMHPILSGGKQRESFLNVYG